MYFPQVARVEVTFHMIDKQALSLLAELLQYPEGLRVEADALAVKAAQIENLSIRGQIHAFLQYAQGRSELELEQEYVSLFDFNEATNLYMTSHVVSEERKRGQLLSELKSIYAQAGLELTTTELPDYLPVILEFMSVAAEDGSSNVLPMVKSGMEGVYQELLTKQSGYAGILEACLVALGIAGEREVVV